MNICNRFESRFGHPDMDAARQIGPSVKYHTFVAIAIGGSAALAAGVSVYSAGEQADATQKAANDAKIAQMDANHLNFEQFQQSRGSQGSAVLPTYLKNPDGSLFEGSLGSDLVSGYKNSDAPLSSFQDATGKTSQALAGANKTTNDIFNGGVTNQLLTNTAPVRQARTSLARSSSLDALNKTLADINATQAGHGFSGDSYGNRMMEFAGQKSAGDSMGAAHMQNVQDIANTTNYGDVTLPMQNLQLPGQMASQNNQVAFMPQANWLNSINQRMQPLNEVRIGQGAFTYQPLPTTPAAAYMGTANALTGATSALSNGVSQYANMQNQQNLLNSFNNNNANIYANNALAANNPYSSGAMLGGYSSAYNNAGYGAATQSAAMGGGFDAAPVMADSAPAMLA